MTLNDYLYKIDSVNIRFMTKVESCMKFGRNYLSRLTVYQIHQLLSMTQTIEKLVEPDLSLRFIYGGRIDNANLRRRLLNLYDKIQCKEYIPFSLKKFAEDITNNKI